MAGNSRQTPPLTRYWRRSKLPAYSLALVLPMLLFYEIGIIFVHHTMQAKHGYRWSDTSDWLIRRFMGGLLGLVGWHGFFMSGVLIAAVLVVWQVASRRSWEVRLGTLLAMLAESVLLATALALLAVLVLDPLLRPMGMSKSLPFLESERFREIVFSVGSGVYEEFVFRFVGVSVLAFIVTGVFGVKWRTGAVVGIVVSALLFAWMHYVGSVAWTFTWSSFISRAVAGAFFGLVFVHRGFGIAAGTHVMYNLLCDLFYVLFV